MDYAQYMNNQTMANMIKRSYDINQPNVLNPKYLGVKIGTHIVKKQEAYFPQYKTPYQRFVEEINKDKNQRIIPDLDPYYKNMKNVHECHKHRTICKFKSRCFKC